MLLRSLGTLETQILVLPQEYDDGRRSAASVFLETAQKLYKLSQNAQCLMRSCRAHSTN